MFVTDNSIAAEGLGNVKDSLSRKGLDASKKMIKYFLEKPRRLSKLGANVGSAFASRSPKAVLT